MKKIFTLAICYLIYLTNFAQAPGTITTVENVYGGRINAIVGGKIGTTVLSDTFRVIVATESANSIFYATAIMPTLGASSMGSFTVLPSANATVGFGSAISKMAFHRKSETIFFIANGNVYATTITATAATQVTTTGGYIDIAVDDNSFFALTATGTSNTIYYSTINNTTGALTAVSNTNIAGNSYSNIIIGKNDKLYLFRSSTDPQSICFNGNISTGITTGIYTTDAMASLSSSYSWNAMGVYTDGTVFIGGTNGGTNPYKYVANAASFGAAYTTVATNISGTSGSNIEFRDGLFANYYVYFGSAYSNAKGAAATWNNFGNTSFETHSNDGYVRFFQENIASGGILLLTTDAGLGWTKNSGATITDINNGILATQVEDFDMNSTKTFGWLAAKDGIRYVNNYNTTAKAWTTAFWPSGDGSPYYSAEMVGNDSNKAYVGNVRIYKTTNKGTSWSQVFTPENAPYNFPQVGVRAEAIAVSDSLNNIVMAGFYNQNSGQYGGVFYSMDSGSSWTQLLINASVFGQDVNVNDIEMTTDSGKIVAYIGVDYINSSVRGMYKAQWNGASWSVQREEIYSAATSLFSINDIVVANKDTIVAVGSFYNAVLGHSYPISFSISRSVANIWRSTVNDTARQNAYTACAWNKDTLFYAYQEKIYYDIISFNATSTSRIGEALYSTVDNGTEINVMYYDELLVGSTTGFRSMRGATKIYTAPINPTISIAASQTNICPNTSVTFTATVTNPSETPFYQWKVNGNVMGANSTTFTTNTLPNNATITCSITTTLGTVTSNTITINVYGMPAVSPITGNLVSCKFGEGNFLFNNTANGVWSSSNNSIASIAKNGKITAKSNGVVTISYTVTNSNGCSNKMMTNYKVATVSIPASISGASSVCVGKQVTLTSATAGGIWTSVSGRATINKSGVATGTSAGYANIVYTVSNTDGCSNYTNYTLVVNAIPDVPKIIYTAGTTNPQNGAPTGGFCVGKTFVVAGVPASGLWSANGCISVLSNGTATINTTGAGSLTYNYTNANGCSNSRTMIGTGYNCLGSKGVNNEELKVDNLDFKMYPNPASSIVNIQLDRMSAFGNIIITDMLGKQIKNQNLTIGSNTIDISNLTKGFYLVSMLVNGQVQTKKLIVE
ncbi:MAG: T9SS type A sorting domain-containing protein [Chitinophagaceae bacterium]